MNDVRGKTALVLSGGGSRGAYEVGAWQALSELGIKIDIVVGTSVGSINGAMVCQGDLDLAVGLWKEMETHMVFDVPEDSQPIEYVKEIVRNGGADTSGLKSMLEKYIDEEKIRKSPMEYGLVVVELLGLKPHYLFKEDVPQGRLVDHIMASSSVFPAIHAYNIDGRDYIDGGYADVLPINMALSKGAETVIAVKLNAVGVVHPLALRKAPNLITIESGWDLGNVLIFDKLNSRRIMRLGYLDTMKAFGLFDGNYFTFAKKTFNKTDAKLADACARAFALDPTVIYTKETLISAVREAIGSSEKEFREAAGAFKAAKLKLSGAAKFLREMKNVEKDDVVCFVIAENLKEKGADSIFLSRSALKILPGPILAARFLNKYGLI